MTHKESRDDLLQRLAGLAADHPGPCIIAAALVHLADTIYPAVAAFYEATKIGGAFGPGGKR